MKLTRRDFIKASLVFGGSLVLPHSSLYGSDKRQQQSYPAYGKLEGEGKLAERVQQAYSILEECRLCPRQCGANRSNGERGYCRAPARVMVYVAQPHFGEEISLTGKQGSGILTSMSRANCFIVLPDESAGVETGDEVKIQFFDWSL